MTIPQAIKKYPTQLTARAIQLWIENGSCPFGYCIRTKSTAGGRNTYFINEALLRAFLEGRLNG